MVVDQSVARSFAKSYGLTKLFDAPDAVKEKSPFESVDVDNKEPYRPEWDDLSTLFALVRQRKVTQVLEFGCGFSTSVFAHALALNERDFGDSVRNMLRRTNPFRVSAVDDMQEFVELTRQRADTFASRIDFHVAQVRMTTFQGRICTEYESLPNVCPDFIYLDGPSQASAVGEVLGISTRHPDRLPMACDILRMEHFLLPGTLILVDGRTANARFLKANLQREWRYEHDVEADQHYFEMIEEPLGIWNRRQLEFCLGADWRSRPLKPVLAATPRS